MLIDADKPLSKSLLWSIQRDYFNRAGMQAWQDDVVPHQISCNPFMARAYAQMVFAYLRDCAPNINLDEPIYIIELGAGSGRLTHHLIHQLLPLLENGRLANLDVRFVLTDFTRPILDFWQNDLTLKPLVKSGLLDFALFDVTKIEPLKLINAGIGLTAEKVQNPVVLLANYFFDSIPQDSFVIEDGELFVNLLSLHASRPQSQLIENEVWENLTLAYEAIPMDDAPYETELYNDILADYEAQLPDTTLSFPNVGLDCIRFWAQFGDVLLLTADRGLTHAESLIGQGDPVLNPHGSFSMMVNFHAITEYVERTGGTAFVVPHYQDNVQTLAYVLGRSAEHFSQTRFAFEQVIVQNGPDDYFPLRKLLESQVEQMEIDQLLSFIRWSVFDGDVLNVCFARLETVLKSTEPVWYPDVAEILEKVKWQYLPIRPDDDLIQRIDALIATICH